MLGRRLVTRSDAIAAAENIAKRRAHCTRARNVAAYSLLLVLLVASDGIAHDGPAEVIERLTVKMERQGRSAELLYQRASEYRTLGKLDRASRDLKDALQRSPKHFAAWLELSRIQLAKADADAALSSVESALKCASASDQAVGLVQRSAVLAFKEDFSAALADIDAAIAAREDQVDWYLQRSAIQSKLGQLNERVAGLKAGWRATDSAALKVSMIDAMIDAGQAHEALALVERELVEVRFLSSWLIRRARCRLLLGEQKSARDDLLAAVAEITPRIHLQQPDLSLIVDRGFAFALLGDVTRAKADLEIARRHQAQGWLTERLERAVAERG
jgi:tetratricopeptide (TPR) repeat protein